MKSIISPVTTPDAINLDTTPFVYRAEGNANLVLGLCGRPVVLRLRKSKASDCHTRGNFNYNINY